MHSIRGTFLLTIYVAYLPEGPWPNVITLILKFSFTITTDQFQYFQYFNVFASKSDALKIGAYLKF